MDSEQLTTWILIMERIQRSCLLWIFHLKFHWDALHDYDKQDKITYLKKIHFFSDSNSHSFWIQGFSSDPGCCSFSLGHLLYVNLIHPDNFSSLAEFPSLTFDNKLASSRVVPYYHLPHAILNVPKHCHICYLRKGKGFTLRLSC